MEGAGGYMAGVLGEEHSLSAKRPVQDRGSEGIAPIFQQLVEIAEEGVLIADATTRKFLYANLAMSRMLGFDASEICSMGVEDVHPRETLARVLVTFDDLAQGRKSLVSSIPLRRKDGAVIHVDIAANPIVIEGRKCAVGFFRNVSDRLETEEALRFSEDRYRHLFDRMASCVAVYEARASGADFVVTDFNGAAEQVEGITKADVIGRSVEAAFPEAKRHGLLEVLQRVWRTGSPEHAALVARREDGRISAWRDNYVYKLPSGDVVAVYEDATEREKAKEELGELMRAEQTQRSLAEALASVALGLAAHRTLHGVLNEVLLQAKKIVPHTSANIMLAGDSTLRTALAQGYEALGGQEMVRALALPVEAFPLNLEVVQKKTAIVVEDTRTDPRWVPLPETHWIRSHLAVPIVSRDRVLGILRVDSEWPGQFTLEDASRLGPLASAAAVAVENAQLYEQVQSELAARRQTEGALRNSAQRLRDLAARLAEVQETERMRISQELHDRVGQTLTALGMRLDSISDDPRIDPSAGREAIAAARTLLDESIRSVRTLMAVLRPAILDDYGLPAALCSYQSWFQCPDSLDVAVDAPDLRPPLPKDVATALFRIAQEALANVVKHAHASHVSIRVADRNGPVHLEIEDDGIGFDPNAEGSRQPHWGVAIMRERAEAVGGSLTVHSSPGCGTRVVAEVPRQ